MRTTHHLFAIFGAIVLAGGAYGQTPTNAKANSSLEKGCDTGHDSAAVKQECLKVAKKMESGATSDAANGNTTRTDGGNPPTPNTVTHSSPVMDTPKEAKEAKNARTEAATESPTGKEAREPKKSNPSTAPASGKPQPQAAPDK